VAGLLGVDGMVGTNPTHVGSSQPSSCDYGKNINIGKVSSSPVKLGGPTSDNLQIVGEVDPLGARERVIGIDHRSLVYSVPPLHRSCVATTSRQRFKPLKVENKSPSVTFGVQ
ncbi:hypothetical protein KI387_014134, partial [Taxus chinensis]